MTESETNATVEKKTEDVPPAKKKRTAERQITKDDEADDDDNEGGDGGGSFKRADETELKKRRIVRAKRPARPPESTTSSSNPFANVALAGSSDDGKTKGFVGFGAVAKSGDDEKKSTGGFGSSTSTFGSGTGFSGFATAAKAKGFGFGTSAASDGKSTGFGFGSAASDGKSKNLFDISNTKNLGFGFGGKKTEPTSEEEDKKTDIEEKAEEKTPAATLAEFPKDVDVKTGEEGETLLLEIRVSVRKWEKLEKSDDPAPSEANLAAPAVPPSSSSLQNKEDEPDAAAGSSAKGAGGDAGKDWDWRPKGAGPLKVLEASKGKVRLVHRTQGKNHDDKPIAVRVNDRLWKESKVIVHDNANVQVVFPVPGGDGPPTHRYLFRSKEEGDLQKLADLLNQKIEEAKSCFEPAAADDDAEKAA